MAETITLYSAKLCGDCQNIKAYMDAHGIGYEQRDIREHPEYAKELFEHTGKEGVPYIRIGDQWLRGYEVGKPFSEEFARALFESITPG
jgi:glutaredoxin